MHVRPLSFVRVRACVNKEENRYTLVTTQSDPRGQVGYGLRRYRCAQGLFFLSKQYDNTWSVDRTLSYSSTSQEHRQLEKAFAQSGLANVRFKCLSELVDALQALLDAEAASNEAAKNGAVT